MIPKRDQAQHTSESGPTTKKKRARGGKRGAMSQYIPLDAEFEQDYAALLQRVDPTWRHVGALVAAAMRWPARCREVWAALTGALLAAPVGSSQSHGLWCVLDGLLKAAPLLYGPMGTRLPDFVDFYVPWDAVPSAPSAEATPAGRIASDDPAWCVAMVATWKGVLPPSVQRQVDSRVRQRSAARQLALSLGAALDGAGGASSGAAGTAGADATRPATRTETEALRSEWDRFDFVVRTAVAESVKLERAAKVERLETDGAVPSGGRTALQLLGLASTGPAADDDDDGVEIYVPNYVAGASRDALPTLPAAGEGGVVAGAVAGKREPRKRPRPA